MPTKIVKEINPKYKVPSAKRKITKVNPKSPAKQFLNTTEVDCVALLKYLKQFNIKRAHVERVGSRPTDGKQAIVTFSKNCAYVTAVLDIAEIPYKKVEPKLWQQFVLGESTSDKQQMIDYALKKYPKINLLATPRSRIPHNGMSDALGITLYGVSLED